MSGRNFDLDDEPERDGSGRWKEFECPDCAASNPYDDGFTVGSEVLCYYCGLHFRVIEHGNRFKLKEV